MFARCLALLIIPILPFVPLMAPLSRAHTANAIVAGTIAAVLACFSLVDNRARIALALVGGWVAFSPFAFRATLLEETIAVCWGVSTFLLMAGPFSHRPRSTFVAAQPARPQPGAGDDQSLSLAA
jgi:hypothetical protein